MRRVTIKVEENVSDSQKRIVVSNRSGTSIYIEPDEIEDFIENVRKAISLIGLKPTFKTNDLATDAIKFLNDFFIAEIMDGKFIVEYASWETINIRTNSKKHFLFNMDASPLKLKCCDGSFMILELNGKHRTYFFQMFHALLEKQINGLK